MNKTKITDDTIHFSKDDIEALEDFKINNNAKPFFAESPGLFYSDNVPNYIVWQDELIDSPTSPKGRQLFLILLKMRTLEILAKSLS